MNRITLVLLTTFTVVNGNCQLMNNNTHTEAIHQSMMKWKVYGKRFVVYNNEIEYSIGICTTANGQMNTTVAIEQRHNQSLYYLGHFDQSNLVRGVSWIMLQYQNGDRYQKGDDCDEDRRVASIIFICGSNSSTLTIIEDSSRNDQTCNYLFEMQIPELCSSTNDQKGKLSAAAIFLIVLFSLTGTYLIIGFLYMHFVRGARGFDRIPNLAMWQNLISLAADGWSHCCRCERSPLDLGYRLQQSDIHEGEDDELLTT